MAAGLKHIKDHIKAVKNIQKITSSMKMISANKFIRAEKNLVNARPLGVAARHFYILNPVELDVKDIKIHLCPVTSDRGLCGSMPTVVCKFTRKLLVPDEKKFQLICVGEKCRLHFYFDKKELLSLVVNGIGHKTPTFLDASLIALNIMTDLEFFYGKIIFARYTNVVSYKMDVLQIYAIPLVASAKELQKYETDDGNVDSYVEFSLAALFFYALSETYVVELASRMNAMNNASKNAGQLGKTLTTGYNRLRQSAITRELIDIVSGAQVVTGS